MGTVSTAALLRAFSIDEAVPPSNPKADVLCEGQPMAPLDCCIRAEERIERIYEAALKDPASSEGKEYLKLERHQMSMMYRRGIQPTNPQPNLRSAEEYIRQLELVIGGYKRSSIYPGGDGKLTPNDQIQIRALSVNYPWVAELFLYRARNGKGQDPWIAGFVKFCLRSCGASGLAAPHWVDIFVKYPDEVDQLMEVHLDKRLGATDPQLLQLREDNQGREYLAIKVEGEYVRFHGDKEKENLTFHNEIMIGPLLKEEVLSLTKRKIYDQMGAKTGGYFDVEVFEEGILNWDAIQLGSRRGGEIDRIQVAESSEDPKNIKIEKDWLYKLPVWRSLTREQVNHRYGKEIDLTKGAAMAVCGTRLKPNFDIADTHGFLELIIPDKRADKQGQFLILPMGFQPTEFPGTLCGKLKALQRTADCLLHYPDESVYLTHRQRYNEVYPITLDQLGAIEERLGRFVVKGRQEKEVFQPTGINCARHVTKLFQRTVGVGFTQAFKAAIPDHIFSPEEIASLVKKATKNLDSQALETIITKIKGIEDSKLQVDLVMICLGAIELASSAQVKGYEWKAPKREQLEKQIRELGRTEKGRKEIQESLGELIRFAFNAQQFYDLYLGDVEVTNPLLGPLHRLVSTIPWKWLRNLLFSALLFLLGSWRGYSYQKKDGTVKTLRCWSSTLHKEKRLFLPAGCFNQPKKLEEMKKWVGSRMFQIQPT
jgi:hypothetical protein